MSHRTVYGVCGILLFLLLASTAYHVRRSRELEQQEAVALRRMEASEVSTGELFDLFASVARSCNRRTPHLYVAKNYFFNAATLGSSTYPYGLRRGKVVISQELIQFFGQNARRGLFAHEISHLTFPPQHTEPSIREEIDMDIHASEYVGIEAVHNMLDTLEQMTDSNWWRTHLQESFPNGQTDGIAFERFKKEVRARHAAFDRYTENFHQ